MNVVTPPAMRYAIARMTTPDRRIGNRFAKPNTTGVSSAQMAADDHVVPRDARTMESPGRFRSVWNMTLCCVQIRPHMNQIAAIAMTGCRKRRGNSQHPKICLAIRDGRRGLRARTIAARRSVPAANRNRELGDGAAGFAAREAEAVVVAIQDRQAVAHVGETDSAAARRRRARRVRRRCRSRER